MIYVPRKVPLPLKQRLKEELHGFTSCNSRRKWKPKRVGTLNGHYRKQVRTLLGLHTEVTKYIKVKHFLLPTRSEILGEVAKTQYFSMLDLSEGFWQVSLEKQHAVVYIQHPLGRHCFFRLPFGLCLASDLLH